MAESVEEWLGAYLSDKGWRIATAESCTGGLIASRITDVSGSSAYFEQGFITYSNEAKMALLGVSKDIVATEGGPGAVSEDLRARDGGRRSCGGGERSRAFRHGHRRTHGGNAREAGGNGVYGRRHAFRRRLPALPVRRLPPGSEGPDGGSRPRDGA